ncbi:MAG: hypothetical protein JST67_06680 [Bacteroidetes bacterium]|nr:hypothetical protein [Bacteroidota bacterium]
MKNIIIKYKIEAIGLVIGALLGWAYWYFLGCTSGTCAITSSPVNSSLYGAFVGMLLAGLFKNKK